MKSYLQEFIILILIAAILCMKFCGTGSKQCPELKPDTVTVTKLVYDTVIHRILVPAPTLTDVIYVEVPADSSVDTAAILQVFYNHYFYEQEFGDSNIKIMLRETISRNSIIDRDFQYQLLQPTAITNTTTITPPAEQHFKVLAGFMIGGTREELTSISPQLEFITKRDNAYSVGYNLSSKSVELGMKWKISFSKK